MLDITRLKILAHQGGVGRSEQLLLLLAVDSDTPKTVGSLKKVAAAAGIRWVRTANISDRLAKTDGMAIRTTDGWEISEAGKKVLFEKFPALGSPRTTAPAHDLRKHVGKLANAQVREFVEEAVSCCEQRLWRAAVVLSWCGAVAVLHDHVVKNVLLAFNTEARRRDAKWKDAKTADDLGRMKEHDFLDVLAALSVIGKNVKMELQDNCLALRNGCGHPNSLLLSEARVAAHLEMLILNVFSRF